jgi:hypothetical protein
MALAVRKPGRELPPQPPRGGDELRGADLEHVLGASAPPDPFGLAPFKGIRNAVIGSAVFWAALAAIYFVLG